MTASSPPQTDLDRAPRALDLRLYLANRFLSTMAVQIQVVAVGWQVYDLTNDPVALGYVGLFEFLPMLLLALPAGDLADRVDRRLVLIATYLVQALACGALVALTIGGYRQIWLYYLVITLFGVARGISTPSQQSVLAFLVPTENLPSAVAWNSSAYTVANFAGPALGGALLAAMGPSGTYIVCVAFFLLSVATTFSLRMRRTVGTSPGTAYRRIADGIVYMGRQPIIIGAISLDLFAVLFGSVFALLPIYQRDILHVGPEGLGLLRAAPALGAAAVAFALAKWPLKRHVGGLMFAFVAVFGTATVVFGLSRNFYVSLAALAVTGGADMISVFVRQTLVQLVTPDRMRGRVGAVNSVFIGASNELGQFRAGLTAGWFGTVPSVVIGGVATLVIVGLWARLFPPLMRVDRFSDVAPES